MKLRRGRGASATAGWVAAVAGTGAGGVLAEPSGRDRGAVPWAKVLAVLAINRLCDPGSEFTVHRHWFLQSAMDELLGVDFAVADKDRLYRCLDRLLAHKDELFQFLVERWKTLFDAKFDVLLYDLTSTYFEGGCEQIPKAKHGYSRDGRRDCRQVVIALVVTPDGLPLAYEVLAGNTSDKTTLKGFLAKIEALYGKARRVWVMDRGMPTEAALEQMRSDGVGYLVGTPKSSLAKLEQALLDKPWQQVHEGMRVKLVEQDGELYVLARERGPADQGERDPPAEAEGVDSRTESPAAKVSRPRQADREVGGAAEGGGSGGEVRDHPQTGAGRAGEPTDVRLHASTGPAIGGQWSGTGSYILRASLPWTDGPTGPDRSGADTVAVVHATGPRRGGVPHAQERPGPSADLPSNRGSGGGPHPGGVPGLLPVGDAAGEAGPLGPGPDAAGGVGRPGGDPDGGRADPDDRWPSADPAALHRAGGRTADAAGEAGLGPAAQPPPRIRPEQLADLAP